MSGYLTILSLCCWFVSKKREKASAGRDRDSAIREVKFVERVDMREM